MIDLKIEKEVIECCPDISLGCIQCQVKTEESAPSLWEVIDNELETLSSKITAEKIRNLESVASSKQAYKRLGKDPNRYRLSAEALLRRVANGKGLYKINNVVDTLNLVSIRSGFSIGGYNAKKIEGSISLGKGKAQEDYQAIGRGYLNIENLPVFRDNLGAFGSPTSDSIRTQIDTSCTHFLMIIISFQGEKKLQQTIDCAQELLKEYTNANKFDVDIIKP